MTRNGLLLLSLLLCCGVAAQNLPSDSGTNPGAMMAAPAPVTGLTAEDTPDDHGHSITLTWQLSADDGKGAKNVRVYEVFRWVPFYLDSMYAAQDRVDSLQDLEPSFRHSLTLLRDRASTYSTGGKSDSAKLCLDSVADIRARLSALPGQIKQLQKQIAKDWERAPEAHAKYPNSGEWRKVGETFAGITSFINSSQRTSETASLRDKESGAYLPDRCDYYYRVDAVSYDPAVRSSSVIVGPVQSSGQWYNKGRTPSLFATAIFSFLVILFVMLARKGRQLYVRPLAGIDAVDEAIGRATEMGKPILYVLGSGTASDIATIASFSILGRVAKRVADYKTSLIVPTYDPIVMSVAQEIVKTAYLDAGRPDAYKDEIVYFVTQNQFAYAQAVTGVMMRERPATNIYMGKFFAESLILAETGALAGSIQISGTDEPAQIPFFVVACDYTLIGEELYAASAYLGREPILLGSLKAQDWAKAAIIILAILGVIAVNIGAHGGGDAWMHFRELFRVIR